MSIKMPAPPKESTQTLYSSLEKLPSSSPTGGGASLLLRDAQSLQSNITYPHKVYAAGLKDIVNGNLLNGANLVSWRYLIQQQNQKTAAAEVNCSEATGGNKFSEFNPGSLADATLKAIQRVEGDPNFQNKAYELRLLRVPALYVTAIWLKDTEGTKDVLIPIGPTNPALKAGEEYSDSEMVAALRQPAEKKLRFDSSPAREQEAT